MELDVFFTPEDLLRTDAREALAGASTVVIDVLRASTTLIYAASAGAGPIHIVAEPEDALSLRDEYGDSILLCGERDGLIIPGFDLGNSPGDYTRSRIGGRRLAFCSTNGSRTILSAAASDEVLIGGFVNLPAIVDELRRAEKAVLLCSGKLGRFCIEDAACAGMIIDRLAGEGCAVRVAGDSARLSHWLFERYLGNPEETLFQSEHPRYLAGELGLQEDVAVCTAVGTRSAVPRFSGGIVEI